MSVDDRDHSPPERLRLAVQRDLKPVRPLLSPWVRAVWLLPIGIAICVGVPWMLGLRRDASVLGGWLSWGASGGQILVGLVLVGIALRESVPGRALPRLVLWTSVVCGLGVMAAVTVATWAVSPTAAPVSFQWPFFSYCLRHSALIGVPLVALAAWLAARALPLRPITTGALYGLGAGLIADAGWRLFCDVSAPGHVLLAHGGAVLLLMVVGMAAGTIGSRIRR